MGSRRRQRGNWMAKSDIGHEVKECFAARRGYVTGIDLTSAALRHIRSGRVDEAIKSLTRARARLMRLVQMEEDEIEIRCGPLGPLVMGTRITPRGKLYRRASLIKTDQPYE